MTTNRQQAKAKPAASNKSQSPISMAVSYNRRYTIQCMLLLCVQLCNIAQANSAIYSPPTLSTAAFQNAPRKSSTTTTSVDDVLQHHKPCSFNHILTSNIARRQILLLQATADENQQAPSTKGRARLSSTSSAPSTNSIDSFLSTISSDISGIVFGLIGLSIAFVNRLSSIDFDATDVTVTAETMGRQSRSDLLAVFAAGAVLLNGISKLDVTSALAETVVLEGSNLGGDGPIFRKNWGVEEGGKGEIKWALESVLSATPARSAVLLLREEEDDEEKAKDDVSLWTPCALAGVVPNDENLRWAIPTSTLRSTPILDKFLTGTAKESYLPTLQALPGKVEFTYLPANAQEALLLPVYYGDDEKKKIAVLVLGSDTAKSFTPRDVAWCQVLASRIATFLS